MVKSMFKVLNGKHGSALIVALVTTVVVAMLALAIVSITMMNLTASQADALNNDAYYAAESGANSAVEQLKSEVLSYYGEMIAADSTQYGMLYENFFSNINTRADTHFMEPIFSGITTETTFTPGTVDTTNDVYEFLISSTATAADKSQYRVDAKLYVKRVDISTPVWLTLDDVAYKIGGTLNLNAGYGVYNGGNVFAGALNNPKNIYYSVQPPGVFKVTPGIADSIEDILEYPSYSNPVFTPTYTVTAAGPLTLNSNTINPATGQKLFSQVARIVSEPGVSFTIDSGTDMVAGTIIYKKGAGTLTIKSSNSNHTVKCYSDGDVVVSNGPVYADIYCRGNISTSGNFHGNVMADGNCTNTCNTYVGTMIVHGSITANGGLTASFYADGPISINNGDQGNNVIYSKTSITMGNGNYANVALFSAGSISITGGSSLTGAIIAKGSVNQNAWLTLNYSRTAINNIMDPNLHDAFFNNFFFPDGGGGEMEVEGGTVIVDEEVTAVGRLN